MESMIFKGDSYLNEKYVPFKPYDKHYIYLNDDTTLSEDEVSLSERKKPLFFLFLKKILPRVGRGDPSRMLHCSC